MKQLKFPEDELPHKDQVIEWWYFNGFLSGKRDYAFMTCLFKANPKKIGLGFLKLPFKNTYFSHSILFDLKSKKVIKEVLPFVIVSKDSFKEKNLFINYCYPLRKEFIDYELSRIKSKLKVKTKYFDLEMREKKKPLLENNGYLELGKRKTYYYSYPNLEVEGSIGKEKVTGIAWHDRQWSKRGWLNDNWLWFSIQMPDNTQIICFNYKGEKFASISYPDNTQEDLKPEFKPLGNLWKSKRTGFEYELNWQIKIGKFLIKTKPLIKDCEINFGEIHYWEGPLDIKVNGIQAKGFMEYLAPRKPGKIINFLEKVENIPFEVEKLPKKLFQS